MSDLHSVRVPAAMIVTALLIIILMSSSHTTYTFSHAPGGYALAARESRPVVLAPAPAQTRSCVGPRVGRANTMPLDWMLNDEMALERGELF
jgi:hypothetical protein